jgi:hypothetical protein
MTWRSKYFALDHRQHIEEIIRGGATLGPKGFRVLFAFQRALRFVDQARTSPRIHELTRYEY